MGGRKIMYHNLFRVTLLCAAISLALTACGAVPTPTLAPITEAPIATEVVSTTTEIAPTNTPEPTATQVVLGVVAGTIAFVSNRDGNYEIYVMNGDGSELKNLTNNPADDGGEDYGPAWSPDGKRILFSSNRDGNAEIYVMNADGSGLINLTNAMASDDFFPKWNANWLHQRPGRQRGNLPDER
jgi:TolB protein